MEPTVTISLKEYNELLEYKTIIIEKSNVLEHAFTIYGRYSRSIIVLSESETIKELLSENENLQQKLRTITKKPWWKFKL